jgi:hypothetical protein
MASYADLYVDPSYAASDPRNAAGDLVRSQWQLFADRYRPLEQETIDQLNRDIEPEVDRAGDTVRGFYSVAQGTSDRNAQRFGLSEAKDVKSVNRRKTGLAQALDVAATKNNLRREWEDTRLDKIGEMLSIGKGIAGTSMDSMGDASSMASARAQAGASARAASKAQETQLLGTLGGIGLAAALAFI